MIRFLLLSIFCFSTIAQAEWAIDFSRRAKDLGREELKRPSANPEDPGLLDSIFTSGEPLQEVVVLNTEQGFVPSTIRARVGSHYKLHIVNVNEREKNVSFVLDAFSEHHATYFGKIKSIIITPKKDGIFSFQSPETSAQGRLIVFPSSKPEAEPPPELRAPANAK
jgi:hypothetical protein